MSMQPDGKILCDRDGVDVGNGSVANALVVNDRDPDNPGHIRNLHFCRDREEDGKTVRGCANRVLSASNLKYYEEHRDAESEDS